MADDREEPSGSCPCCRRRDPRQGFACTPCRSRLKSWLSEIPDLFSQLLAEPLAPSGSPGKGGPVSGSRERPLPIRVDLFDLTHRGAGEYLTGEDQVGHVPVWLTLETWAANWATYRDMGEAGAVGVEDLCHWMRERVDDMADVHPAIDECWREVRSLHGALSAQLGRFEIPDYKRGVPCPKCNALALVHHSGSDYIECGSCPMLLTFEQFDEHVRTAWADQQQRRKANMAKAKALHSLLSALRAAGWQHRIRWEEAERNDDGAPLHEGYTVHEWHRGHDQITLFTESGMVLPGGYIWYAQGGQDEESATVLTLGVQWVASNGYAALQRLARAAGVLTSPQLVAVAPGKEGRAA